MKYTNKRLNITIENSQYLDIKEFDNYVKLYDRDTLKFIIYDNSSAKLYNNSSAVLYNNSRAVLWKNSSAELYDNSNAVLYDNSSAKLYNNSRAVLWDNSSAELWDNSSAKLWDNSSAKLYNNSSAKLYNNSSVELWSNSSARLYDFSIVWIKSINATYKIKNHFGAIIKQEFKIKKKTIVYKKLKDNLIAELQLNKGQIFQSEKHNKCRTNKAKILSITSIDKKENYDIGYSKHDNNFVYKVGEIVEADYDENIKECSTGIHFFLNRISAEKY